MTISRRGLLASGLGGPIALEPMARAWAQTSAIAAHADIGAKIANRAGLALLARQVSAAAGSNAVIAPTCVVTALAMAAAGAMGRTKEDINNNLRWQPQQDAAIDTAVISLGMLNQALVTKTGEAKVSVANAIFVAQDAEPRAAYVRKLKADLDARVDAVKFADSNAVEHLNHWFAGATRGLVPSMFGQIPAHTRFLLGSAVAFEAPWATSFDPKETTSRPFYSAAMNARDVPMMEYLEQTLPYRDGREFEMVRVPYAGGEYELIVALPRETAGFDLATWAGRAREAEWATLLDRAGYVSMKGHLALPKLQLQLGGEIRSLVAADQTFGALLLPGADLRGITEERLKIDQVVHRTFVRMDEWGTVAAAATGIQTMKKSIQQSFDMIVDRPYLFAISHVSTGALAFVGYVADPADAMA